MLVYFCLLFFVTIAIYHGQRSRGQDVCRGMYFFACLAMTMVAGVRYRLVGTDSGYYAGMFDRVHTFKDVIHSSIEPGYFFIAWISRFFVDNYFLVFTLVAAIAIVCVANTIKTYSTNEALSFFVYITGGFYSFTFNGMRQGLAVSIFFLAIGALFRRKILLFIIITVTAAFFHKSVLVVLPAYFLVIMKNNLRHNLIITIVGVVSAYFFNELVFFGALLDERFSAYQTTADSGHGIISMLVTVCLCLFFLFFKNKVIFHRDKYDVLLNMFILATSITVVSTIYMTGASGIRRLALYFSMSSILLWPIVYSNISNKSERFLFAYVFVILYLVYFALNLQYFGNMVPYLINPYVGKWVLSFL